MYAVGRHLAEINESELKIDVSGFEAYKLHKYSLGAFNIQENFASLDEVNALTVRKSGIAERVVRRILCRPQGEIQTNIQEKHFSFDPDIMNLSDGIYLNGYWQSEKYFSDIEDIIRREFTLAESPDKLNVEFAKRIEKSNSISIHIRRCDYIDDPGTLRIHGMLGLDFYSKAINYISEKVQDPHFYVFSDDYEGAKRNIKIDYPTTFMKHNNDEKNYADMWLMSLCKHHIIANSTFSWWGAWLTPDPDKIVIAPKLWFSDEEMNSHTQDLIPDGWIRL